MVCKIVFGDCIVVVCVICGIGLNGIEFVIFCFVVYVDLLNDCFVDFFDFCGSFVSDCFCYFWS